MVDPSFENLNKKAYSLGLTAKVRKPPLKRKNKQTKRLFCYFYGQSNLTFFMSFKPNGLCVKPILTVYLCRTAVFTVVQESLTCKSVRMHAHTHCQLNIGHP